MMKVVIGNAELYLGDALDVLATLTNTVDAVITDPPYCGAIDADWDNQWGSQQEFFAWLDRSLSEYERLLAHNGSLYLFASAKLSSGVERVVGQRFNVLNHLVWVKPSGAFNKQCKAALRRYFPATERIIFAEQKHATKAVNNLKAKQAAQQFEPIRQYLDDERQAAGLTSKQSNAITGNQMATHYYTQSQWALPSQNCYEKLAAATGYFQKPYKSLKDEYETLKRPFDVQVNEAARVFNGTKHRPFTDVWQFASVQAYKGKHPTEKPLEMMEAMVLNSTRPHALVLDSFMGSGTTGMAAIKHGRRFVGIERDERYFELACKRIESVLDGIE